LRSINEALRGSVQDALTPLLAKWENRFPGKTTDTMVTWNNVLDDRDLMIRRLEGQITVSRSAKNSLCKENFRDYYFLSSHISFMLFYFYYSSPGPRTRRWRDIALTTTSIWVPLHESKATILWLKLASGKCKTFELPSMRFRRVKSNWLLRRQMLSWTVSGRPRPWLKYCRSMKIQW